MTNDKPLIFFYSYVFLFLADSCYFAFYKPRQEGIPLARSFWSARRVISRAFSTQFGTRLTAPAVTKR